MTETQHTPYRELGDAGIVDAAGRIAALVYGGERLAASERRVFIIRACNSHTDLLAACEKHQRIYRRKVSFDPKKMLADLDAAIARATT